MTWLQADARQPAVTCRECGTKLGVGTTKDVYSHLMVCLKVERNSLDNIRDNAEAEKTEHGRRILHIVNALQGRVTE